MSLSLKGRINYSHIWFEIIIVLSHCINKGHSYNLCLKKKNHRNISKCKIVPIFILKLKIRTSSKFKSSAQNSPVAPTSLMIEVKIITWPTRPHRNCPSPFISVALLPLFSSPLSRYSNWLWLPYFSPNRISTFLPHGLCSCCSFSGALVPQISTWLPQSLQVFAQMSFFIWGLHQPFHGIQQSLFFLHPPSLLSMVLPYLIFLHITFYI